MQNSLEIIAEIDSKDITDFASQKLIFNNVGSTLLKDIRRAITLSSKYDITLQKGNHYANWLINFGIHKRLKILHLLLADKIWIVIDLQRQIFVFKL